MEYFKELQASKIFKDASEFECQAMMYCFKTRFVWFERGENIINQGDEIQDVFIILKGAAIVQNVDNLGDVFIVSELKKGEIYGAAQAFAKEQYYKDSVIASERCLVMFMNKHRLLNQCDNKCKRHEFVIKNIMNSIALNYASLIEKVSHMSKKTIRDKLLSYFYSMSEKSGNSYFEIPFNKTELANYLSVDRSALSNELSKMKKENIIDFDKKQYRLIRK